MSSRRRAAPSAVLQILRRFGRKCGFPVPTLAASQFLYQVSCHHSTAAPHQTQLATSAQLVVSAAPLDAACACLIVAGKSLDTAKKLRDLLPRAYSYHHHQTIDPDSDKFIRWRNTIVQLELAVLNVFQYRFPIPLPFDFFFKVAKKCLAGAPAPWPSTAFSLLYDLYQSIVVIEYPPHILALSAIFLAARTHQLTADSSSSSAVSVELAMLTPASPDDVLSLACLPEPMRAILDSYINHVYAATHLALDMLIPATPAHNPLFETYRSIKIELNHHLGLLGPPPPSATPSDVSQHVTASPPALVVSSPPVQPAPRAASPLRHHSSNRYHVRDVSYNDHPSRSSYVSPRPAYDSYHPSPRDYRDRPHYNNRPTRHSDAYYDQNPRRRNNHHYSDNWR